MQLPIIAAMMLLWFCLLFLLRIIPRHHWGPIKHIVRRGDRAAIRRAFKRRAGLRSLSSDEREALRVAVVDRMPGRDVDPDRSPPMESTRLGALVHPEAEGARLVRLLRRAAGEGGIPMSGESEYDAGISLFLFSDQPVAVRLGRCASSWPAARTHPSSAPSRTFVTSSPRPTTPSGSCKRRGRGAGAVPNLGRPGAGVAARGTSR